MYLLLLFSFVGGFFDRPVVFPPLSTKSGVVDYQSIIRTGVLFSELREDTLIISKVEWLWSITALENLRVVSKLPYLKVSKGEIEESGIGDITFEIAYQIFLSKFLFSCLGGEIILPTTAESLIHKDSKVLFGPYLANTLVIDYLNIFTQVGLKVPFYDFETKGFSLNHPEYLYSIGLRSKKIGLFTLGIEFSKDNTLFSTTPQLSLFISENWEVIGGIRIFLNRESSILSIGTRLRL